MNWVHFVVAIGILSCTASTLTGTYLALRYLLFDKKDEGLLSQQESSELQEFCFDCGGGLVVLQLYDRERLDRTAICCPQCRSITIDIAEFQRPSG